jgi:hypothetical protein
VSLLSDESTDASNHAQNIIAYKYFDELTGTIALMFGGMHDMRRGSAEHVFESIKSQLVRDGLSFKNVSNVCFDTCAVNFGERSGVAKRILDEHPHVTPRRCINHRIPLAVKHAVLSVPYAKVATAALNIAGMQSATSPLKARYMDEANEEYGGNTPALGATPFTRWGAIVRNAEKFQDVDNAFKIMTVFKRAGQGDTDGLEGIIEAGAKNFTSDGLYREMCHKEFHAVMLFLVDSLRKTDHITKLAQSWTGSTQSAITDAVLRLKSDFRAIMDNPAVGRPLSFNWRAHVLSLQEKCGQNHILKSGRGRAGTKVDGILARLSAALVAQLEEYVPEAETKLQRALATLFNYKLCGGITVLSAAVLTTIYGGCVEDIAGFYRHGHTLGDCEGLMDEMQSTAAEYVRLARRAEVDMVALADEQLIVRAQAEKEQHERRNKREASGIEPSKRKQALPPVPPWAGRRPHTEEVLMRLCQAGHSPFHGHPRMLLLQSVLLSSVDSEAPVESMFSRMKIIVTARRTRLTQAAKEQLLYLHINGPGGTADEVYPVEFRLSREKIVKDAAGLFVKAAAGRRIARKKARVPIGAGNGSDSGSGSGSDSGSDSDSIDDLAFEGLSTGLASAFRYKWGEGSTHYEEQQEFMEKHAERLADQERRLRESREVLSEDARAELEAKRQQDKEGLLALTNTGLLALREISDTTSGAAHSVMCLGTGHLLELRECIASLEENDLLKGRRPHVRDEVVVTGLEGNVWWRGTVAADLASQKKYRVVFDADNTFVDLALSEANYGPALMIAQAHAGQSSRAKPGWMYILPAAAEGPSEPGPEILSHFVD